MTGRASSPEEEEEEEEDPAAGESRTRRPFRAASQLCQPGMGKAGRASDAHRGADLDQLGCSGCGAGLCARTSRLPYSSMEAMKPAAMV